MKKILLLMMIGLMCSCTTTYTLTSLNCVGKIIKKKTVKEELGDYKYLVVINPETKLWVISCKSFNVGDSVLIQNKYSIGTEKSTVFYNDDRYTIENK